jgi:Domain of unknown function (DUF4375)
MNKPTIEWHEFLAVAPYFQSLVHDVLDDDTDITSLHPKLRALLYFDIFDGEVSNGGIAQYYYNQAFRLPDFARAPEYIAQNAVFEPIMHIVNAAHAAWADCAAEVEKAVKKDEWPEKLFKKYAPKFDALQTEFYAMNHLVSQAFCAELIQNPHDYFDFKPMEGVAKKGISRVSIHNNTKHFRFENGFPVGPNVFEKKDGSYVFTRFYNNRSCMEYDNDSRQGLIHYPSKRSISLTFDGHKLEEFKTDFAFWNDHGVRECYSNNQLQYSTIIVNKESLSESWFHANGQLSFSVEKQNEGELCKRYWPNGQLNASYLRKDPMTVIRYSQCFAENGDDLMPNGTGEWYELVKENYENKRIWFEGILLDGKIQGQEMHCTQNLLTGKIDKSHR